MAPFPPGPERSRRSTCTPRARSGGSCSAPTSSCGARPGPSGCAGARRSWTGCAAWCCVSPAGIPRCAGCSCCRRWTPPPTSASSSSSRAASGRCRAPTRCAPSPRCWRPAACPRSSRRPSSGSTPPSVRWRRPRGSRAAACGGSGSATCRHSRWPWTGRSSCRSTGRSLRTSPSAASSTCMAARRRHGRGLGPEHAPAIARAGTALLAAAREQVPVAHPEQPDVTEIGLAMLHGPADSPDVSGRNSVVLPSGRITLDDPTSWTGTLDRSPGGTGTSARMAALHARGELGLARSVRPPGRARHDVPRHVARTHHRRRPRSRRALDPGPGLDHRLRAARPPARRPVPDGSDCRRHLEPRPRLTSGDRRHAVHENVPGRRDALRHPDAGHHRRGTHHPRRDRLPADAVAGEERRPAAPADAA